MASKLHKVTAYYKLPGTDELIREFAGVFSSPELVFKAEQELKDNSSRYKKLEYCSVEDVEVDFLYM
jgi:hypothetical protein